MVESATSQTAAPVRALLARAAALAPLLVFCAFLALYVRTAAPSVLGGDSGEFQMAAATLGVPHPTTYPLYVLLGKGATLLLPFGDLARRVTLVSSFAAALAAMLMFLLARRVTGSTVAGALAAVALGVTPGLWNVATIAEVYALLAALLLGLSLTLVGPSQQPDDHPLRPARTRLRLAALLAGLGFTHHGLFAIAGLPLFAALLAAQYRQPALVSGQRRAALQDLAVLGGCFLLGMTPWLYPLAQYARYGPFSDDYGLPQHYFWGAPSSWGAVFDLMTGRTMAQGVFRPPALDQVWSAIQLVGRQLMHEFGPLGVPVGLAGCVALLRRQRWIWAGSAWVFYATLAYLVLLGPAVQDAPVFTLPMLLPWALWVGVGGSWIARALRRNPAYLGQWVLVALVAATLAWGYTRTKHASKRRLWLFREWGQATLQALPPQAAVITHWDQGMVLQYLRLAEGQRPDVWVDIVEPGDGEWGQRASSRYAGRPVFFVGQPADVVDLPVERVRDDDYANLFRLRAER